MEHVQEYAFPSTAAGSEPVKLYCPGIKISRKYELCQENVYRQQRLKS